MLFQYCEFGDPLAFVRTQEHWALRPAPSPLDEWLGLLSWEAVWSPYDEASCVCFWRNWPPKCFLFNCQFINPIYFVGSAVLVAVGAWRGWLNGRETLLSVGMLLIPYLTKGYVNAMNSQARFAAAVFPVYLVAGQLLVRLPAPLAYGILAGSGALMGAYAALFAAGYPFY